MVILRDKIGGLIVYRKEGLLTEIVSQASALCHWTVKLRHTISRWLLAFEGGGPERDTVLLCNALAAKGVRVTILVLRDQGPLRSLVDSVIRVVVVPGRRMRYVVPGLRQVIRALAPHLVLSSGTTNLPTLLAVRTLRAGKRPKLAS